MLVLGSWQANEYNFHIIGRHLLYNKRYMVYLLTEEVLECDQGRINKAEALALVLAKALGLSHAY